MESIAWLLNFGDGEVAAVGKRELLHLVPQPEIFEVPRTPRHCSRVLIWQSRVVPVWDLRTWLSPGFRMESAPLAAIIGYQSPARQQPRFGAVLLIEPPGRISVNDSDACELPSGQPRWKELAISCFLHGETPVAILDLPLMFSGLLADNPD